MANNVNLIGVRGVYAAIAHVVNNYYRFTNVGMAAALRDPASKEIQDATNPFILQGINGGKAVLGYATGTANPQVIVNWLPAYTGGYRTTRTAAGGSSGSNGVLGIQGGNSQTFTFNKRIEFEIIKDFANSDVFAEPLMLEYLEKLSKPEFRIEAYNSVKYEGVRGELVRVGNEIMRRLDRDMLIPMDDDLITTMMTKVGRNISYPWDNTNGTANAPITQVYAFDSDGKTPDPDFYDFILNTQRDNMFEGKPILVGGRKVAEYMQKKGIVGLRDTGFKLDALVEDLPVHWYYDARIDSIMGQDEGLMWDSGAAALQNWLDHSPYGVVRTKRHENMAYGNMTVNIAQYKGVGLMDTKTPGNISLDLDLRVKEGLDSSDYPTDRIVPSARYGVYARPVGYFTNDNTQDMYYMTGVYRFKLLNRS